FDAEVASSHASISRGSPITGDRSKVSLRKRLIDGAYAYARRLQAWRKRERDRRERREEEVVLGKVGDEHWQELVEDVGRPGSPMDISDVSDVSSISSVSASTGPEDAADSEDEETRRYLGRYAAIRERIQQLESVRTLKPRTKVPKRSQLSLVLVLYRKDDPVRFRRNLRVAPNTFDGIVRQIENNPVFGGEEETGKRQLPVDRQLAIALFRFGHYGNSASVESIAQWAGVSAGMVVNATRRVIIALLDLHDTVIRWPNAEMKEDAKDWVEEQSCAAWRDGWLLVDGTLVPLAEKPAYHREAYFDRKSNYSFNVQLITLPNLRIIDYVIGHTGSTHDSTAFAESRTCKDHAQLIGPNEWIWGDSAYPSESWCVTPFKKPANGLAENKTFNYWVSHVRIRSEHAVGFLKGRFQSLRRLRQQIKNETDHLRALEWIRACLVLHTLIHNIESEEGTLDQEWEEELIRDGAEDDGHDEDDEDPAPARRNRRGRESSGQRKRRKVKEALFASGVTRRRNHHVS
ncbi:unnamed protein product, partial [Mycena citricolor]